jgi:hypothetical protein
MPAGYLKTIESLSGELKGLAAVMRNTFYLAVSISPLVVLCPRKLDSEGIRRDYLISVRHDPHPSVHVTGLMFFFFIAYCRDGER